MKILIPVYNDWEMAYEIFHKLARYDVLFVDDGSEKPRYDMPILRIKHGGAHAAISAGLSMIKDDCLIMGVDEARPQDIINSIPTNYDIVWGAHENPSKISLLYRFITGTHSTGVLFIRKGVVQMYNTLPLINKGSIYTTIARLQKIYYYPQTKIIYKRKPRRSKWTFSKKVELVFNSFKYGRPRFEIDSDYMNFKQHKDDCSLWG